MLMDDFKHMRGQDHDPRFRALAISVSCSLFAPGSEAPPLSCFCHGYSCADLSFRGLLNGLLTTCGAHSVDSLADKIIEIAAKYEFPTSPFRGKMKDPWNFAAPVGETEAPGSMLQIFVHKDIVDEIAYASMPMGVPIKGVEKLSAHLRGGHTEGQARVFMHPAVFTDTTKAHLFHYTANPMLSAMDPSIEGSRGAFIKELRKALEPILGDYKALRKAFLAIEGRS